MEVTSPRKLKVQKPRVASAVEQTIIGMAFGVPIAWLLYYWNHQRIIHFEAPALNLGIHALLLIVPIVWAGLVMRTPMKFEPTDEISLGASTYFDKLTMNWWMMFMMLATPVYGLVAIAWELASKYLSNPDTLSTSPQQAALRIAVTFCLAFFYAIMLRERFDTRVSDSGVRNSLIRFYDWPSIDHIYKREGFYAVFHRANPRWPATSFKLRSADSRATFESYVTKHNVPLTMTPPNLGGVKIAVVTGFIANIAVCTWLRSQSSLSLVWLVLISFGMATILTLLLERKRGISKMRKLMPVLPQETDSVTTPK